MSRLLPLFAVLLVAAAASRLAHAAVFTVDILLDGPPDHDATVSDGLCISQRGSCSLRAAIEQANALAGLHEIRFAVAGTIALATEGPLPPLVRRIELRGDTAPGYAAAATDIGAAPPRIQLDGTFAPAGSVGIRVSSGGSGSLIRALAIVSMPASGIEVTVPAVDVRIRDCWLGIEADGSVAGNDIGVYLRGNGARLGRYVEGDAIVGLGNVISGNRDGVLIGSFAADARLHGNRIGLSANGLAAAPNTGHGVEIEGGSANRIGGVLAGQAIGNLIASNGLGGINITGGGGHEVKSNRLGVNRNGAALASPRTGVLITGTTSDVAVGGNESGEDNLIANYVDGIHVGSLETTPARITLSHNTIGSFVTFTGVGDDGIRIQRCDECLVIANTILRAGGHGLVLVRDGTRAYLNRIGYVDTVFGIESHGVGGHGILVFGNDNDLAPPFPSEIGTSYGNKVGFSGGSGIRIEGNDNLLYGALVGVTDDGTPMPNAGNGVEFGPLASGNRLQINAIAYNGGGGIVLEGATAESVGNTFSANLVAMNDGLEIDLGDDGVDANDAGDVDEGPNRRLNHPVLLEPQWVQVAGVPRVRVRVRHDAQAGTVDFPVYVELHLTTEAVREAGGRLGFVAITQPGEEASADLALPAGTRGGHLTALASAAAAGSSELSAPLVFGDPDGLFFDGFEGEP
jgi:hypothetical protein